MSQEVVICSGSGLLSEKEVICAAPGLLSGRLGHSLLVWPTQGKQAVTENTPYTAVKADEDIPETVQAELYQRSLAIPTASLA